MQHANATLIGAVSVAFLAMRADNRQSLPLRLLEGVRFFIPTSAPSPARIAAAQKEMAESQGNPTPETLVSLLNLASTSLNSKIPPPKSLLPISEKALAELSPEERVEALEDEKRRIQAITQGFIKESPTYALLRVLLSIGLVLLGTLVLNVILSFAMEPLQKWTGMTLNDSSSGSVWLQLAFLSLAFISTQGLVSSLFVAGANSLDATTGVYLALAIGLLQLAIQFGIGYHWLPSSLLEVMAERIRNVVAIMLPSLAANPPNLYAVKSLLIYAIAVLVCIIVIALFSPALRYAFSFSRLTMGKSFERHSSVLVRGLASIEFFGPLLLCVLFCPLISKRYRSPDTLACLEYSEGIDGDNETGTCKLGSIDMVSILQIFSLGIWLLVRLFMIRHHVQAYLDGATESVASAFIALVKLKNEPAAVGIRNGIVLRSMYMSAFATQGVALTTFFGSLLVLYANAQPFMSGILLGNSQVIVTTLPTDASIVSKIFAVWFGLSLPGGAPAVLLEYLIFVSLVLWYVLSGISLLMWLVSPETFRASVTHPQL